MSSIRVRIPFRVRENVKSLLANRLEDRIGDLRRRHVGLQLLAERFPPGSLNGIHWRRPALGQLVVKRFREGDDAMLGHRERP